MKFDETNNQVFENARMAGIYQSARNTEVICLTNNRLLNQALQFGVLMGQLERKLKKMTTFFKVVRIKDRKTK